MEKTIKDRKKLNLGVKKEFQRWMLLRVMVTVLISSVVAALILYFYARHELVSSFFDAHVKIRRVSDLLLPVVAAGSLVSLVGGAFLALFLPQKIAGPIYRIEQGLKSVEEGDLSVRVRLRKGDTLQDFAGEVDDAIVSMREKVRELKEGHEELEKASGSDSGEIAGLLQKQKERLDRFQI